MAQMTTYACDRCGAEKREANHWFVLRRLGLVLLVTRWKDREATSHDCDSERHLCGERCLAADVAEFAGGTN